MEQLPGYPYQMVGKISDHSLELNITSTTDINGTGLVLDRIRDGVITQIDRFIQCKWHKSSKWAPGIFDLQNAVRAGWSKGSLSG